VPEKELNKEFQEYVNSPEGQQNWKDEFGDVQVNDEAGQQDVTIKTKENKPQSSDPILGLFDSMLGPVKA
jgi:hypothetical protein